MKKKILILALALLLIASASTFAIGIGGAGTYGWGTDDGISGGFLTLKLDDLPLLGIDVASGSGSSYLRVGATADWWQLNENLSGIFNWYWGLGGYGRVTLANSPSFAIGARLPIGLNAFILDPLELFLEAAPAVGVSIGSNIGLDWGVQGALGFRFWF